jgi:hypothetical protein
VRGADDRADVAGVLHTVEPDRQVPAGLGPALAVDADHARPGPERRRVGQQLLVDVDPRPKHVLGLPGGIDQVLALGDEAIRALAAARELADLLELLVVG